MKRASAHFFRISSGDIGAGSGKAAGAGAGEAGAGAGAGAAGAGEEFSKPNFCAAGFFVTAFLKRMLCFSVSLRITALYIYIYTLDSIFPFISIMLT